MAPLVVRRDATPGADASSLFARYCRDRSPADREALVVRHLPLARHLARRYATTSERDDVEQVAYIGLLKAIDRFDPSHGAAFSSFAVPTILGELKRYFRDLGWTVRVPRSLQELGARLEHAVEALTVELGRTPTAAETAARCDTTVELVLEARSITSAHRPDSLDRTIGDDDDASSAMERIGGVDPGYARVERAADLEQLITRLPEKEQNALRLRFGEDLMQREIGERLGISQMHVSRLLRHGMETLREEHAERDSLRARSS